MPAPSAASSAPRSPASSGRKSPSSPADPVAADDVAATEPSPALIRLQVTVGLVLIVIAAATTALIEVLLVPLYIGATIFPITILLAVASNIGLPILARRTVNSVVAAALPVVVWILVVLRASQTGPGGDVLLPGSGALGVVSIVLMLSGLTAGVLTVTRTEKRSTRD
ncbi:hypothetical protein SAMN05892883_4322 [Jatrophihabitans sp. GAS493]|uniref:hypothetical protein n=1 Tax=Jatrophihabitans sp. GAS493 TaxID=1907575 RepID=UPI000BB85B86|nr:hypothetical protein [Jatrophihabitans sp. GAS493]SOD75117.1 hypothetical protein SAMN05892883_4322 [Jatrophihabitans sp. GAS493]